MNEVLQPKEMKTGVIITAGPLDWQIIQQEEGVGTIQLSGVYYSGEDMKHPTVYVRIVKEDTSEPVVYWTKTRMEEEASWSVCLENVPVGGLYRIESCLVDEDSAVFEWGRRGDMIHHIGIGDVYVIAGQSNSAGYGKDFVYDPPELGVHLMKNNERWDMASHPMNDATGMVYQVNMDGANTGHSPYLSFAKYLHRELGYPIGLVQCALGGSELARWNPKEQGDLYYNMVRKVKSQGGRVKGILWYQGCSDTEPSRCNTYYDRFLEMVTSLRQDLNQTDLPILTVQINRMIGAAEEDLDKGWSKIREAQRQAAKKIKQVTMVPTIDLTLSDGIHINAPSNLVLGERLARTAMASIYNKRGCLGKVLDLEEIKFVSDTKLKIVLENIVNRVDTLGATPDNVGFQVQDEVGKLQILRYDIISNNEIMLELDRSIQGDCYVDYAFGQDPKGNSVLDFATHMPLVVFYHIKVEK